MIRPNHITLPILVTISFISLFVQLGPYSLYRNKFHAGTNGVLRSFGFAPELSLKISAGTLTTATSSAIHHPNLWGDEFIESIARSNKASSEDRNIQMMVRDVREALKVLGEGSQDVVKEQLLVVDLLACLGIQRYFQEEIKQALDNIYRYSWTDKGITSNMDSLSSDLGETAMAFKLLRMYGYNVSSDVFRYFTKEGSSASGDATQNMMNMYNLYRASGICFPKESLLEEVHHHSKSQLVGALKGLGASSTCFKSSELHRKVAFALQHPWHRLPPRLEARFMIESHGRLLEETSRSFDRMAFVDIHALLKLGKADFNFCQALHQKELQDITRWWRDSGFARLSFVRQRPTEIYFSIASFIFEPELAAMRMAYTKSICLLIVIDDLFDCHAGNLDDLVPLVEALRRWDPSLVARLSQDFQICFNGLYNTVNSLTEEAAICQGQEISTCVKEEWERLIHSFIVERDWKGRQIVPSLEMYIDNGKISIGLGPAVITAVFFAGEILCDKMLQEIDFRSDFMHMASLSARLTNDTKSFQAERERGELASSVACLLNDNPGTSEDEAVAQVANMVENIQKNLNLIFLKRSKAPKICKQVLFDVVRSTLFFYAENDGLTDSARGMQNHVKETLFDPLL